MLARFSATLGLLRFLCLTLLLAAFAQAQDPLLWGTLIMGPILSASNPWLLWTDRANTTGKARPILFEIWYPASNAGGPGLSYERYASHS